MAWGRKKSGGRKEPRFGLAAALADLRLDPKDRIPAATDMAKPKKAASKRPVDEDEDDDPPPPAPRERRSVPKGGSMRRSKSRSRLSLSRLVYWGFVFGLWGAIAIVGAVVWAGAH